MRPAAVGIIFNHERTHVLVLRRRDVNMWILPSGGIDEGETPEEAVVREVLEETGLHVSIKRKVAEYTPINKLTRNTHVYECVEIGGTLSPSDESLGVGFYRLKKLPQPFFFLHQAWLNDALLNEPTLIKKPITQVTYWALLKYFCLHPITIIRGLLARMGCPFNSN